MKIPLGSLSVLLQNKNLFQMPNEKLAQHFRKSNEIFELHVHTETWNLSDVLNQVSCISLSFFHLQNLVTWLPRITKFGR